jgi:dihydroorotate dehydrogenase
MGFPNKGAAAAARRLRRRTGQTMIAVNVGKSRAAAEVNADYRESVRQLAPLADLLVLNVSSPNTPGLREMQTVEALSSLVREVRAELDMIGVAIPLLVKVSPDLDDAELDAIAKVALDLRLDGIVAVNTTTSRAGLASGVDVSAKPGGLSGPPLRSRALEVLRRLHATTKGQLVLVSVGGIETASDAWERIRAGATLVQAYTGFVYGGPLWPHRINRGLVEQLRATGVASIQDLVGADERFDEGEEHREAFGHQSAAIASNVTSS